MNIKRIHIEGFGVYRDKDFDFKNGFNPCLWPNGEGKSTLVAFIKAMFFGLEQYKKNSGFVDRLHYYPFAGGGYGGTIVFELNDEEIRIERTFDEKSPTKDSLTVYKNNKITEEFGPIPGETIFGIDKLSYEKTAYIDADTLDTGSTGSIKAKLSTILSGAPEENNVAEAIETLESKAKRYKKSRAGQDLLSETSAKINQLNEEIANLKTIEKALPGKQDELDKDKRRSAEVKTQLTKLQQDELRLKDFEQLDQLTQKIAAAQTQEEAIQNRYPAGLPTQEQLDSIKGKIASIKTLSRNAVPSLSKEEESRLKSLKERFANPPSDDRLSSLQADRQSLNGLSAQIQAKGQVNRSEYEARVAAHFVKRAPTDEELKQIEKDLQYYEAKERALEDIPSLNFSENPAITQSNGWNKKPFLIAGILSLILFIGGIGILFVQLIAGIILLALGFLGLLAVGFLYINKKASHQPNLTFLPNEKKEHAKEARDQARLLVQQRLLPYGYDLTLLPQEAYRQLMIDLQAYRELTQKETKQQQEVKELKDQQAQLQEGIRRFLAEYHYDLPLEQGLDALEKDLSEYRSLLSQESKYQQVNLNLSQSVKDDQQAIDSFVAKYQLDQNAIEQGIEELSKALAEINNAEQSRKDAEEAAIKLKQDKQLDARPLPISPEAKQALEDEQERLTKSLSSLGKDILADELSLERLNTLQAELAQQQAKLAQYKKTYELLIKTSEMLAKAEEKVINRYVEPIKDQFTHYASLFQDAFGSKVALNADFELTFEENGKKRNEQHLSAGQRSVASFCFRLALLDKLYQKEKPFLVLDDPFVSLDEERLKQMGKVIDSLSPIYQILYFTCHPSRKLK